MLSNDKDFWPWPPGSHSMQESAYKESEKARILTICESGSAKDDSVNWLLGCVGPLSRSVQPVTIEELHAALKLWSKLSKNNSDPSIVTRAQVLLVRPFVCKRYSPPDTRSEDRDLFLDRCLAGVQAGHTTYQRLADYIGSTTKKPVTRQGLAQRLQLIAGREDPEQKEKAEQILSYFAKKP